MNTSFLTRLFDLIAPRQCPVCGHRLSPTESVVCAHCLIDMPYTDFAQSPYDNEMARHFWGLMPVERVAALFYFSPQSSLASLIYDMKYHDRPDIAQGLGQMMARELSETAFFEGIDAIIPMPITRWRQWHRGYNQSEMIARGISQVTALPILDKAVRRTRFLTSQTHLSHWQRHENTAGSFRLCHPDIVEGRHLLLVDDIVTTGATLVSLATAMQQVPDVRFSIATLGYTKS